MLMGFSAPVIRFLITKRWCISLQRQYNESLLHGYETGGIMRDAEGGYTERHLPLAVADTLTSRDRDRDRAYEIASPTDDNGVPAPANRKERLRARLSRAWYSANVQKPTRAELAEAHHHVEEEVEHDAPLIGMRADGHNFDGRHGFDEYDDLAHTAAEPATEPPLVG